MKTIPELNLKRSVFLFLPSNLFSFFFIFTFFSLADLFFFPTVSGIVGVALTDSNMESCVKKKRFGSAPTSAAFREHGNNLDSICFIASAKNNVEKKKETFSIGRKTKLLLFYCTFIIMNVLYLRAVY